MSAHNDSDFNNFIIRRDDSITDFFRKWDELLTSAKAERLLDYLTGKTHVKPEADVEALNKTRLSFFETALIKQTKQDENNLTQLIWQQITDNELNAYLYAAPIIAVNPDFPTQEEINNSRTRILYNSNAYLAYLYKENEPEVPYDDVGRDIQCRSCRPSQNFIGYGSNNQHEELEAQHVMRIRSSNWRELAEKEAKRTPSIDRLQPDDTIQSISLKLTNENRASADDAYSKSSKHYEADVAAVAKINASILKFLLTRIEGIEATSAAPFIKTLQWDKVLDAVRTSYGSIQSPKACNDLTSELQQITLGDDETVTQFIHRTRNIVANIQIICELLEDKNPRMIFSQAYEGSIYTLEKWQLLYPNNHQYTGHIGLLHKLIVGIEKSRLDKVAYDFNVNVPKPDQTIEKLIKSMIIGETALPIEKQVIHVSSVTTSSNGNSSNRHFCSYHSFGGVISSHDTKDCKLQKQGMTTVDPSNSKYQVLKSTGEHFTARPRTPLPSNSTGNKRKGNNGKQPHANNPSGKACWKCVKLQKEGETIPDWVTTTHTPEDCTRTKAPKFKKTNASFAKDTASKSDDGALSKTAVNQIMQAMQATINKPAKTKKQVLIENGEDGYFAPGSS